MHALQFNTSRLQLVGRVNAQPRRRPLAMYADPSTVKAHAVVTDRGAVSVSVNFLQETYGSDRSAYRPCTLLRSDRVFVSSKRSQPKGSKTSKSVSDAPEAIEVAVEDHDLGATRAQDRCRAAKLRQHPVVVLGAPHPQPLTVDLVIEHLPRTDDDHHGCQTSHASGCASRGSGMRLQTADAFSTSPPTRAEARDPHPSTAQFHTEVLIG